MKPRRGISLLEVIVAMALATVLLGSVWTLFQILTKRQLVELDRAETNQLMRSLHQRLTRDFNNLPAIDVRPRASSPAAVALDQFPGGRLPWPYTVLESPGSETLRLTVLRGDRYQLTLGQFVEPADWDTQEEPDREADRDRLSKRDLQSTPPMMLKRVHYSLPRWPQADPAMVGTGEGFSEIDEDQDAESQGRVTEFSREETSMGPTQLQTTDADWQDPTGWVNNGDSSWPSFQQADPNEESEPAANERQIVESVSDVKAAVWSYFDGQRWRRQWDSDLEQRLPVAIRLRWRHREIADSETASPGGNFGAELIPDDFAELDETTDEEALSPRPGFDAQDDAVNDEKWYDSEWIFLLQTQPGGEDG